MSEANGRDKGGRFANGNPGGPISFAAILAAAVGSEPPGEEHTSNVERIEREYHSARNGRTAGE